MNKFGLLLFLLAITFTQQIDYSDIDIDAIYDKLIIVAKGFSTTGDYQCSAVLNSKKAEILTIVNNMINEIKNGAKFSSIALKYGLKLMGVDGMSTKCKALDLVTKVLALLDKDGIKETGYRIVNNTGSIYNAIQELKDAADLDGKLVAAGKIIRYIFGIETL